MYGYHKLPGISEGEWLEYYRPTALGRLRRDLKNYVNQQLNLFSTSGDYGEFFCVAEFEEWRSLDEDEIKVFKLALPPEERNTSPEELHPADCLNGLRAVMLQRIVEGDLTEIRSALELFDSIIESAIEAVDERNPRSYITLQSAAEFAPWFIDRLLESVDPDARRPWRHDPHQTVVGETLQPLKPILDSLGHAVHQRGWPRDDLALGRFLLVVDYSRASKNLEFVRWPGGRLGHRPIHYPFCAQKYSGMRLETIGKVGFKRAPL